MKKPLIGVLALLMAVNLFAAKTATMTPEQEADKLFDARNTVTDTAKALENADRIIEAYKKLLDAGQTDGLIFKYVKAVDFKNYSLAVDFEQRKKAFRSLIYYIDKYCEGNTLCASSDYLNYCCMTLWGRYGDMLDVIDAATSGIAEKIKDYGERLYASDKAFKDYAAALALGRLHWKAPNIIFIMTWPDKKLSRKYLHEFIMANPGSLTGRFYLADTLWDLGEKEKAIELYKEVKRTPARRDWYWEDMKAKELCGLRMKEQGIE